MYEDRTLYYRGSHQNTTWTSVTIDREPIMYPASS
jgi:hypothetical protein